MSHVKLFCIFL